MSKLPKRFEHRLRNPNSNEARRRNLFPFSYNSRAKTFSIGPILIGATDFDPQTFDTQEHGAEGLGIEVSELEKQHLVLGYLNHIIATPRLHNYAISNTDWPDDVARVMAETYKLFVPEFEVPKEPNGFNTGFYADKIEKQGKFRGLYLQVLGRYIVSSSPNLYGYVKGYEHGYAEYDLNMAEEQVQRTSIYAGLGHLSSLALASEA